MKFCLIGERLPHSKSKEIHALFGNPDYGIVELAPENLESFVKSGAYDGYNVTIPYKERIIPFLDSLDPIAAKIGAVNTVVDRNGKKTGYNTDAGGMEYALAGAGITLKDKCVVVLGTGGTSKTARYVAEKLGAKKITVVGRKQAVNYGNVTSVCSGAQVLINATPVGMFPDENELPVEPSSFACLEGVFDVIYNPAETLLVRKTRALGIPAANGTAMLVEQARLAEKIFFLNLNTSVNKNS
jgi:shikimate dehydrogenase